MFISDLRPRAKSLGEAVRKHWGIEIPQSEDGRGDNLFAAGRAGYHRHRGPARADLMA